MRYENKFLRGGLSLTDNPFFLKRCTLQVFDTTGSSYSVYGCFFNSHKFSYRDAGVESLSGRFERLIREKKPHTEYCSLELSFNELEYFFELDTFKTAHDDNLNKLVFTKDETPIIQKELSDGLQICARSRFEGIFESDDITNLNIQQTKVISLSGDKPKSADEWMNIVKKIKHFFEFDLQREIVITTCVFYETQERTERDSVLMADPLLRVKTHPVKNETNQHSIATPEEILDGLTNWLSIYDQYSGVFRIWQKTIYNSDVEQEDLFLWKCQAFELLCTVNADLYNKARTIKSDNQWDPNIEDFLKAADDTFGLPKWDGKYYEDTKKARNIVTHHKPNKKIDDISWRNSVQMINGYFTRCVAEIAKYKYFARGMLFSNARG